VSCRESSFFSWKNRDLHSFCKSEVSSFLKSEFSSYLKSKFSFFLNKELLSKENRGFDSSIEASSFYFSGDLLNKFENTDFSFESFNS